MDELSFKQAVGSHEPLDPEDELAGRIDRIAEESPMFGFQMVIILDPDTGAKRAPCPDGIGPE